MEDTLHAILHKALRASMNEAEDHLAAGGAKNYEEYCNVVGKIEGLAFAEHELLNLVERITNDED